MFFEGHRLNFAIGMLLTGVGAMHALDNWDIWDITNNPPGTSAVWMTAFGGLGLLFNYIAYTNKVRANPRHTSVRK